MCVYVGWLVIAPSQPLSHKKGHTKASNNEIADVHLPTLSHLSPLPLREPHWLPAGLSAHSAPLLVLLSAHDATGHKIARESPGVWQRNQSALSESEWSSYQRVASSFGR